MRLLNLVFVMVEQSIEKSVCVCVCVWGGGGVGGRGGAFPALSCMDLITRSLLMLSNKVCFFVVLFSV